MAIREAERNRERHERTDRPARTYASAHYAAGTWKTAERVVCRVQVSDKGTDVRYIVTSFQEAGAKYLYETVYCSRGRMELMIKDHKAAFKSDRISCQRKEANQFRLFLHSAAYVWTERRQGIKDLFLLFRPCDHDFLTPLIPPTARHNRRGTTPSPL